MHKNWELEMCYGNFVLKTLFPFSDILSPFPFLTIFIIISTGIHRFHFYLHLCYSAIRQSNVDSERLACLNLEALQTRRLKCDLKICYKIIHNEIAILNDDFLCFRSLHILEDIITNCLRAVPGSIHTSISFRIVLLKSGMLCLVQWERLLVLKFLSGC